MWIAALKKAQKELFGLASLAGGLASDETIQSNRVQEEWSQHRRNLPISFLLVINMDQVVTGLETLDPVYPT